MHTATAELSAVASGMLQITLSCNVDAGLVALNAYQAKCWGEPEGCLLQACVCLNPLIGRRFCCTCVCWRSALCSNTSVWRLMARPELPAVVPHLCQL